MNRERGRPQLRFGEQLLILLEKEWLQMVRDPAVIFMGALLPVVLIVLFGWGLSMDLLKVPAVFTAGESTALTAEVRAAFRGSPYFELTEVPSSPDSRRRLRFVKTLRCWEALRARRLRRQEPQRFSPAHGSTRPTPPPGIWFRDFPSWC